MAFGKTAQEYEEGRGSGEGVWIKNFRDPETRIRLLQEPGTMGTMREHYSGRFKEFFPCANEDDDGTYCVGCDDPDSEVRKRNRKFLTNALDEKGVLQLFKMGGGLHKKFKNKAQRLGTVCDRDYIVIKTGRGLDTDYDAEPGEQYPVEFDGPLIDIGQTLEAKYNEVAQKYANAPEAEGQKPGEVQASPAATGGRIQPAGGTGRIQPQSSGRIQPAATTSTTKAAPPAEPKQEPAAEQDSVTQTTVPQEESAPWDTQTEAAQPPADEAQAEATKPGGAMEQAQSNGAGDAESKPPSKMTIGELRAWLSDPERGVEFPPQAARSRLVRMAEEWIAANSE